VPHITIEYVILIPLLFAQILVFPLAATMMTSSWVDARRDAALQGAASHLASTIQQLYLSINREEIVAGNITQASTLPPTIESYPYTANGSLTSLGSSSSRVFTLTLSLVGARNTATASALLGSNARWGGGTFRSNSPDASIKVRKFVDGTLLFSFYGG
jgi:hypothetical protein